jgi:hypothetical protein
MVSSSAFAASSGNITDVVGGSLFSRPEVVGTPPRKLASATASHRPSPTPAWRLRHGLRSLPAPMRGAGQGALESMGEAKARLVPPLFDGEVQARLPEQQVLAAAICSGQ